MPAPARLLPMWDDILLAYTDRSRVLPPEYRRLVARANGDVLPTLLVAAASSAPRHGRVTALRGRGRWEG